MKGFIRAAALTVCFSIIFTILIPFGRVYTYAETKNFSVSFSSPKWKGSEFSYENVSITSPSASHINTLSVFVENGTITYLPDSTHWNTDLLQAGGHKSAVRTFTGAAANSSEVAAIIKQIKFKLDSGKKDIDITIIVDGKDSTLPNIDAFNYTVTRGKNNHYYVYVPELLDWDEAYNKAKTLEYMGMKGYLVTITSYDEDRILDNITTVGAWAGAVRVPKSLADTDFDNDTVWSGFDLPADPTDSVWKWVCGPEAGQKIKITGGYNETNQGVEDPGNAAGYSNWNRNSSEAEQGNEPNNFYPGEFCMAVHYHDKGEAGTADNPLKGWNDMPKHVENTFEDYVTGYFVEFNGLDITTPLTVSVTKTETYSHTWKYETATDDDGDTEVKGKCIEDSHDECEYGNEGAPLEIYLGISDQVYDASPATAAKVKIVGVSDSKVAETLTEAGVTLNGAISYQGTDADGNAYGPSSTTPVRTGSYTAARSVTAGGKNYTISTGFSITPAALTITLKNQTVVKDKPFSSDVNDAIESTSGLCGSDVVTNLVLEADNSTVGKNTIKKSTTAAKPVAVKNGAEDVTSCYDITVVPAQLTVKAKTPNITADAEGSEIVYGKKLSNSTISGTVKDPDTGAVIAGTFTWKTPDVRPEVSDSNTTKYKVVFTPDSSDYEEITLDATLPVVQKDISVEDVGRTITLNLSNTPEVSLYDSETSKTLVEGTDYTVTSVRNGNKQEVTVTGKGNYRNSFTVYADRHNWTGRVIKQNVVDSSADELSPVITELGTTQNEKIGTAIILEKLSSKVSADEVLAGTIVSDISSTGKSYDGDFNGLITLTISNADGSITGAEESCAESAINPGRAGDSVRIPRNAVIGMYFDISMDAEYKVVNKSVSPEKTLVDNDEPVIDTSSATLGAAGYSEKITITVPPRLRPASGYSRTYYLIRVHDDGTGNLDWTAMPVTRNGYKLTFSTDKFSKYAIAYVQSKNSDGSSGDDTSADTDSGSGSGSGSSSETTNTVVISAPTANNTSIQVTPPKTGDSSAPLWGTITVLAGICALGVAMHGKKAEE